jgi:branched-chain amino acid transport system ATP-binding protein
LPDPAPLLKIDNVSCGYGSKPVLHGVTIAVNECEILALVGPNGAGKSTVLRAVFGLISLDSGSIIFAGEPVQGLGAAAIARKGIGFVPQGNRVFPRLTVLENLEIGAYTIRDRHKVRVRIDSVMEKMPVLKALRNRLAGTLSGGERQLVALARVLAADPRLILLDEPSLGLSPKAAVDALGAIRQLNEALGKTIVIIEQNVRAVLAIAHRACLLKLGKVELCEDAAFFLKDDRIKRMFLR